MHTVEPLDKGPSEKGTGQGHSSGHLSYNFKPLRIGQLLNKGQNGLSEV